MQKKTFTKWVNKHLIKVGAHMRKSLLKICIRHLSSSAALSHRIFDRIGEGLLFDRYSMEELWSVKTCSS